MDLDELYDFVMGYVDKLPSRQVISSSQAEERASDFLYAMGIISNERRIVNEDRILLETQVAALYAKAIADAEGKNVTEKKINAECSEKYTKTKETLNTLDGVITYLKTQERIFENAHIFYRNLYRGE